MPGAATRLPRQLLKLVTFPTLFQSRHQPSTNLCAIDAKRVTIMPKDIQLARRIHGERALCHLPRYGLRPSVVILNAMYIKKRVDWQDE